MLPHKALNLLVTNIASRMKDQEVMPFCWKNLIKTIPIWMGFFIFGICDCVRGPTILDLKDILDVKISEISLIFTFFSMGSLAGCILSSLILDKLRKYRFLVLGGSLLLMGSSTAALPYSYNIPVIYFLSLVSGFSSGLKMTGGNVLCANLWKGTKVCSSFVHANQFAWSLGAVLAPITATPFQNHKSNKNGQNMNTTFAYIKDVDIQEYSIRTLYPILGSLCALLFTCFIIAHCKDDKETMEEAKAVGVNSSNPNQSSFSIDGNLKKKTVLTGMISGFLFLAIGSEVVFR